MGATYKITIIGSGFVGQATGKSFAKLGHQVVFCDTNLDKLAQLEKDGFKTVIPENIGSFETDVFFLTVPTPTIAKKIRFDFIFSATKNIAKTYLKDAKNDPLIVVKSTVLPGTTENIITPLLEKHSGKYAGRDFHVAMNPEYLREKLAQYDFENPRLITIGTSDDRARTVLGELYSPYKDKCPIAYLTATMAEMQKYTHNLWNATKISYFNEMREVAKKLNIEADMVFNLTMQSAEASWNPKYGTQDFGPFGGSCLPKDTSAFLRWAKDELSMNLPVLASVIKINDNLMAKNEEKESSLFQLRTMSFQPMISLKMLKKEVPSKFMVRNMSF